jgi:hypothetical protein
MRELIPQEVIEQKILLIRGHKVMLDKDLAILYGVLTKVLIQAVKRNIERFPEDFMFQLMPQEVTILKSQIVTSSEIYTIFEIIRQMTEPPTNVIGFKME